MPRLFTWVLLIASSLSATAQSRRAVPPQSSGEVAAVKTQEEVLRQAELKYNTSAADAVLAGGFVLTAASDGSLWSKEKFLPLVGDKSNPIEVLEYGEMDVRIYGDAAVVFSTIHEKFWYHGKPVEYWGRRTAMWVKQNQRWVCVAIHASEFPKQ